MIVLAKLDDIFFKNKKDKTFNDTIKNPLHVFTNNTDVINRRLSDQDGIEVDSFSRQKLTEQNSLGR